MADNLSDLHEPLIEWVFDRSDGSPLGDVDITEFGAEHGLDSERTYTLLRQCKARGHLDDKHSTMGTPAANLTGYGRAWVEERRRRRGDKVQRMIAARNGLLRWLWEMKQDGRGFPVVKDFLKTAESRFEGGLLTEEEVDRAAASLVEHGLIHGMKSHGRRGPVRAETTGEGDRCVEQYSGDVMAYEQAKHKSGPTYNFGGDNNGNISTGDHNELHATTNQWAMAAEVMKVVEQFRQARPTLTLPEEVKAVVVATVEELEREASSGTPDVSRVRRGLQRLGEHLNTATAGALGNLIAVGALELASQLP